jgi:hypothetical protein
LGKISSIRIDEFRTPLPFYFLPTESMGSVSLVIAIGIIVKYFEKALFGDLKKRVGNRRHLFVWVRK